MIFGAECFKGGPRTASLDGLDNAANCRLSDLHDRRRAAGIIRGLEGLARGRCLPRHHDRRRHFRDRRPLLSRRHVSHETRGQGPGGVAGLAGLLHTHVSRVLPQSVGVAIRPDPSVLYPL